MTIAGGSVGVANDILNIYQHGSNVLVGKTGTIYIPVYVNNILGVFNIQIAIWGKAAGGSTTSFNHGAILEHYHYINATEAQTNNNWNTTVTSNLKVLNIGEANQNGYISGGAVASTNAPLIQPLQAYTNVPQAVQIWIDGSEYTEDIGDENSKGATMYDDSNKDWGTDGTTVWDTGWLTLTSSISWTQGWHYIELKETGGTGGTLIYQVVVNTGLKP